MRFLATAWIIYVVLSLSHVNVLAQAKSSEVDSLSSIQVENTKTNQRRALTVGHRIRYKLRDSLNFKDGRITDVTDSTIVFKSGIDGIAIINNKDIAVVRMPRGLGRMVGGWTMIAAGTFLIAGTAIAPSKGEAKVYNEIALVSAVPITIGGLLLVKSKKIDFEQSWKFAPRASKVVLPPAYSRFEIGGGFGYAAPLQGKTIFIEPAIWIKRDFSIGVKVESVVGSTTETTQTLDETFPQSGGYTSISGQSSKPIDVTINSVSLTGKYYFGKSKFRGFVGVGAGSFGYMENKRSLVVFPTAGIDYNHFRLTLDYNILPSSSVTTVVNNSTTVPQVLSYFYTTIASDYTYFGIKIGYAIGF